MEFVWYPFFKHFKTNKGIFAHSYFYQYDKCFWGLWISYSIQENNTREEAFYPNNIASVIQSAQIAHKSYRSNNFMLLIGGDFTFGSSDSFKAISSFMNAYHNQTNPIYIELATPSKYFDKAYESQLIFPYSINDILPLYNGFAFWTRYYTSWPSFKYLIRESSKQYRAFSILLTFLSLNPIIDDQNYFQVNKISREFEEILSLAQHHDIISGTSMKYVIEESINKVYSS